MSRFHDSCIGVFVSVDASIENEYRIEWHKRLLIICMSVYTGPLDFVLYSEVGLGMRGNWIILGLRGCFCRWALQCLAFVVVVKAKDHMCRLEAHVQS